MSLLTNLVVYYKFDGNSTEATGTGFNGTDTSISYSNANGIINNGAGFNGTTSKIVIADNAAFHQTGDFTINCWAKTSISTGFQVIYESSGDTPFPGVQLAFLNGAAFQAVGIGSGGTTVISDGAFRMLTIIRSGTTCSLYINGAFDSSLTGTPTYAVTNFVTFGSRMNTGVYNNFLSGAVDEFGLWSRALTTGAGSELASLYNGGAGFQYPFVVPSGFNYSMLLKGV